MEPTGKIISDDQLNNAWGYADFGYFNKRDVIGNALLKYAAGYMTGHTIECICYELALITKKRELTKLGKKYLYTHYKGNIDV